LSQITAPVFGTTLTSAMCTRSPSSVSTRATSAFVGAAPVPVPGSSGPRRLEEDADDSST
jgi:hypothetical protein